MFGRPNDEPLFCASFIFEQHSRDADFEALDAEIARAAEGNPGFVGKETWFDADKKRLNASYYWRSMEDLQTFSKHQVHVRAKRRYKEWYSGFHVVISEVLRSYGDDAFDHVTPNSRARTGQREKGSGAP